MEPVVSPLGVGFQFGGDFLLPDGRANNDSVGEKLLFVVQKIADLDGARTDEAMATGGAPSRDAGDGNFQRLAVKQRDDPADGANEARAVEARPGHGAWPGEIVYCSGQHGGENLLRCSPQFDLLGGEVLALGRLNQEETADVHLLLLREALRRACRRADGIVGHGLRRTGDLRLDVSLFSEKPANPGGQAPGCTERFYGDAAKKILRGQKFLDVGAQLLFGLWKHACRNFFAADFKEQFDALFFWRCYLCCLHGRTPGAEARLPSC